MKIITGAFAGILSLATIAASAPKAHATPVYYLDGPPSEVSVEAFGGVSTYYYLTSQYNQFSSTTATTFSQSPQSPNFTYQDDIYQTEQQSSIPISYGFEFVGIEKNIDVMPVLYLDTLNNSATPTQPDGLYPFPIQYQYYNFTTELIEPSSTTYNSDGSFSVIYAGLPSGPYTVLFKGALAAGALTGTFSGAIQPFASVVPLPGALPMFGSGLLCLTAWGMRKRRPV